MRLWITVVVSVLAAISGGQPVEIAVVDAGTGEPITEFEYFTIVATADGEETGSWRDWHTIRSPQGRLTLELPAACRLRLGIRAREYKFAYPLATEYIITADAASRSITHELSIGVTVRGLLLAEDTGEPVVGARIYPDIFTPPLFSPDHERGVVSDEHGRFELAGIDGLGFTVEHQDYLDFKGAVRDVAPGSTVEREIRLKSGDTLFGVVTDAEGDALAGASINDGSGKQTRTDEHGRFEIRGASPWGGQDSYFTEVEAPGFVRYAERHDGIPPDGLLIVLERLFRIRGVVVGPNDLPVRSYTVTAGPGRAPQDWQCQSLRLHQARTGEFDIGIAYEPEANWIGIRAPGFAPFETWVPMDRDMEPLRIRLDEGVTITGRVALSEGKVEGGTARLLFDRPQWDNPLVSDSAAKLLFSDEASIGPDGAFKFEHVRPALYVLHVGGDNFTGRWLMAGVGEEGLDIGDLAAAGVGTISGTVIGHDGEPWPFKDGEVGHAALSPEIAATCGLDGVIRFRTDEHGRFEVGGVPVGEARVSVPYNLTADIIGGSGARAVVESGRTTIVTVDCSDDRSAATTRGATVTAQIRVGDGSDDDWLSGTAHKSERAVGVLEMRTGRDQGPSITGRAPRFRLELDPLASGDDVVESEELNANGPLVAHGVKPGRHTMSVFDAPLPMRFFPAEPLFRQEIEVDGEDVFVEVPLGGGSLVGRAVVPNATPRDPQWAIAHAYVVAPDGRTRDAVGDGVGAFGFRYLDPGTYECVVRHEHLGWCRFDLAAVDGDLIDLGDQELQPGATVRGLIRVESVCPVATAIRARGPDGIEFEAASYDRRRSDYVPAEFTIESLWPGEWEFRVMRENEVLGSSTATIPEAGQVEVEVVIDRTQ